VLDEKAERGRMRDDFCRKGHQECLATAEANMDRAEPAPKIPQGCFPLIDARGRLLAAILPDVAVEASGVAPFGQQDCDRRRPTVGSQSASCKCPQPIAQGGVEPIAKFRHFGGHDLIPRRGDAMER
jgi:hypothetical protein